MLARSVVPLVLLIASVSASAQTSSTSPQTNSPPAITVRSAEMSAALRANSSVPVMDTALRVVSIESKYNLSVSIVRRSQVNGKTQPDAIVHDAITEVYQIIEGRGVLVTGGAIESASRLPADDPDVRRLIGPSSIGKVILGGTLQKVATGGELKDQAH